MEKLLEQFGLKQIHEDEVDQLNQLERDFLLLLEKRLTGLRDGTMQPTDYWDELAKAREGLAAVIDEPQDSPQWQAAFAEMERLMERGPTESQRQGEIEKVEKIMMRRVQVMASCRKKPGKIH
jgi:hypothetical protein